MVNEFVEDILLPRLNALHSVDRSAGIVRIATQKTISHTDGVSETFKTFPIHCGETPEQCFTEGRYKMLVPDDTKENVAFFEQISFTIDSTDARNVKATFNLKFLYWANLAKMGVTSCTPTSSLIFGIMAALEARAANVGNDGVTVQSTVTNINTYDYKLAFGRYDFGNTERFSLYPFGFAAFDIVCVANFNPRCIPAFTVGTPINC